MPEFKRAIDRGGKFFFTVVTYRRRPMFREARARLLLRDVMQKVRAVRPFTLDAIVLLPDHLHCIWTLPDGDTDFSTRWRRIKERFTRAYLAAGGVETRPTVGQERKGLRGVWQQRFWEHVVRDERDYQMHADYIHFNPVKHGHVKCPHAWPWSTFSRWVAVGAYASDWCCACGVKRPIVPDFTEIAERARE